MRRTGSTLLVSLLNSHSMIKCHSELFYHGRWHAHVRRVLKPIAFRYPLAYVNWIALTALRPVVGFKLMVHQNEELGNILNRLITYGWKIISLRRQNALHRVMSEAVLYTTRIPHSYIRSRTLHHPLSVDPQLFHHLLEQERRLTEQERSLLSSVPHLSLSYEADLANPQCWAATTAKLLTFLQVPIQPLHSTMVKTWETSYEELISNYNELIEIARNAGIQSDEWIPDRSRSRGIEYQ